MPLHSSELSETDISFSTDLYSVLYHNKAGTPQTWRAPFLMPQKNEKQKSEGLRKIQENPRLV